MQKEENMSNSQIFHIYQILFYMMLILNSTFDRIISLKVRSQHYYVTFNKIILRQLSLQGQN